MVVLGGLAVSYERGTQHFRGDDGIPAEMVSTLETTQGQIDAFFSQLPCIRSLRVIGVQGYGYMV